MEKIEVRGLRKIYGGNPERAIALLEKGQSKQQILEETGCTVAIQEASFDVKAGEIFVIMGLSGSGKSTVLRCLNRLIEPSAGSVHVDGVDVTRADRAGLLDVRRRKMAMVFQNFGLLPHRSVIRNVEYGLEMQGLERRESRSKAMQALELVGLKGYEEKLPHELSGGMQQRVGLARAIATDAEILLMDEAFSALDPLIRRQMQDELLELQSRMNKTIVFITHDLDEALKLGGRIVIMKDGRIAQLGTPEEILRSPADDYVRAFVEHVDRTKVLTARAIMRRPESVVHPKDGPALAVKRMRESGTSTLFVTNQARKLVGLVRIEDTLRLMAENKHSLEGALVTDLPTTSPDTPLAKLVAVAATTQIPIAVVAEDQSFLGIVSRATLLASIAGEQP
ncbi:glycine betaine/L-proline ABC transporter, ATP-binding protein [Myxococcus xanthus DK 1622]|uniref:Glycine betaine/L-proline ABC transporter, ATP-binding protein n=1 Tax=Myxococcus xanthus (strain DK1622) TaxID=246197 RepID=Q1DA53_MYXXD|nr:MULTISPECIES: glycine betaine/L-proline ABC transporter ATP-binding protein [Myxococcus]ABF92588.1 glycine betaine/L-proline ABC transporter, ATP-binding protein [Myxococcus xanthus DK 1622]NOJ54626.1 glycine betaine/L-proline ABC transporter ATP-binding protein [Myxococcus xanthus]QPM81779.1 glycine betaine/L-proline ABC transporter ATP-binding protein [Myxococcus xanthus]QVW71029.1 glycine betaine/L-proline ABC transporter ATP-binding protein [Myxococcus xanthus DZ2]QZZ49978.1 Glycine bet